MTDVVLLKQKIRPGKTEHLVEWMDGLLDQVGDAELHEMLQAEGVHTESIFVERTDDGDFLLWYFEAKDMGRVGDVWDDLDAVVAEVWDDAPAMVEEAKDSLGELLEDPETFQQGDFELLEHLVNPERPGTPSE